MNEVYWSWCIMEKKSIFRKASVPIIMTLILVPVVSLSGCLEWMNPETAEEVKAVKYVTFSITPSVSAGNGVLNDEKDKMTIPFYANTTSHTIKTATNTTFVNPVISFSVKPVGFIDATADDLGFLHYTVQGASSTVDSESGTHYILDEVSGDYQAIWTGDGTEYVSGDSQVGLTENLTLVLTLDVDETGLSYVQYTYSPQILTVRFTNNAGWSYELDISFYATLIGANVT
jgi:hypothetical protein